MPLNLDSITCFRDIKLISPTSDLSRGSPSSDSIASVVLNFSAGTGDPCIYTNPAFWLEGSDTVQEKVPGAGECRVDRSEAFFVKKLLTPNGHDDRNTEYQFRVDFRPMPGTTEPSVMKAGELVKMTVSGKAGKPGTSTLNVRESRPGAPLCIKVFTLS